MFGNVIRFDEGHYHPSNNSTLAKPLEAAPETAPALLESRQDGARQALTQQSNADPAWVQRLLDNQAAMLESAQKERAVALAELTRIAQALCKDAWDMQSRSGRNPETWPPRMIADLVVDNVNSALRNAQLSQDPALPEKHHQLAADLANANAENAALRQRVQVAEDAVREMKAALAKDMLRRQEAAEKKAAATLVANRLRSNVKREDQAHQPQFTTLNIPEQAPMDTLASVARTSSSAPAPDSQHMLIPDATPAQLVSNNTRVADVIKVVAEYGLCRWKDLSHHLAGQWGKHLNSGAMDNAIGKSTALGLLRTDEVVLEWGGKPTGKMLILTERGVECALALGVKPVESQYSRGLALHKDGAHFYVILEVAGILATRYPSVDWLPSYVLVGDEKYYPDIIAVDSDGNKIYVEVERGTYKARRDDKWLRAAAANSGVIYLVTPNQEAMAAIAAEIEQVRSNHVGHIGRLMAFNVRSYRENKTDHSISLWAYEG